MTGFNDYALDALKVSAVDYLLKPVDTEDLINAVEKAKTKIVNRAIVQKFEVLRHNAKHIGDQNTKVVVPGVNSYDFVKVIDIIRCEGWQKYTKIYLNDGSCIVSSYNLGVFKDILTSYGFYSTHKSHLINKNHILKLLKEGTVIMIDNSEVPVSRRKKEEFKELMLNSMLQMK